MIIIFHLPVLPPIANLAEPTGTAICLAVPSPSNCHQHQLLVTGRRDGDVIVAARSASPRHVHTSIEFTDLNLLQLVYRRLSFSACRVNWWQLRIPPLLSRSDLCRHIASYMAWGWSLNETSSGRWQNRQTTKAVCFPPVTLLARFLDPLNEAFPPERTSQHLDVCLALLMFCRTCLIFHRAGLA